MKLKDATGVFAIVCSLTAIGCAAPPDQAGDEEGEVSSELTTTDKLYGADAIRVGLNFVSYVEAYGSFANNGANVSFANLSCQRSNNGGTAFDSFNVSYRSASQINFHAANNLMSLCTGGGPGCSANTSFFCQLFLYEGGGSQMLSTSFTFHY